MYCSAATTQATFIILHTLAYQSTNFCQTFTFAQFSTNIFLQISNLYSKTLFSLSFIIIIQLIAFLTIQLYEATSFCLDFVDLAISCFCFTSCHSFTNTSNSDQK